jgi:hypothetical protein
VTSRYQVSVLASAIREDLSIGITNAELSQLFGHSGGWAQGMMARYEQEVQAILFPVASHGCSNQNKSKPLFSFA